jgi:hypothetical protein
MIIPERRTRCSRLQTRLFAPWYIVNADDKRRARLNCISHLLSLIPYKEIEREPVKLPRRQKPHRYVEPRNRRYNVVPEVY